MSLAELRTQKTQLLAEASELTAQKNRLFGNVDVTSPISRTEKALTEEIAAIYSKINSIVLQIRAAAK